MALSTSNITMQYGGRVLFEKVSVKFTAGFCYGLIGANGSGNSTFLKILAGDLESSAGHVMKDPHERISVLRQDQFAYEEQLVIHVVMQGHAPLWAVYQEKEAIYGCADATEDDYIRASELEVLFGEMDGYAAEAKAGELLLGVGIPTTLHHVPMSAVAPGLKLRVLLAQALFADPDILLIGNSTL